MTGAQFKSMRLKAGLKRGKEYTLKEFARAIGYEANDDTVIWRFESDRRPIPPWIARLAYMYSLRGVPKDIEEQTK